MKFLVDRVRGMQDILPPDGELWERVEGLMRRTAGLCGFSYMRTPILEHTELIDRSAGDSSDIVQKEMYTFNDKSGRSVTLRPEFTAGVLRSVVTGLLGKTSFPLKIMYFGPCYRYEKPQAGRLREFFQFGLEIFGSTSYLADIEAIFVAHKIFTDLGISGVRLEINAVGCSKCRESYLNAVKHFFESQADLLCETCRTRIIKNPLRVFDCKDEKCQSLFGDAPNTTDFICEDCQRYFEKLKKCLESLNIYYLVNTRIVRGLDYYTKFVFEFITNVDGHDLTICGGGRYDDLSASLGGKDLPATGLAIGVERIIKLLNNNMTLAKKTNTVYVACVNYEAEKLCLNIISDLRELNVKTDFDIVGRELKSQMKYADKMGYNYVIIIGMDELNSEMVSVKNMFDGSEVKIEIKDFSEKFLLFMNRK
jgi:histidyl-tRNA synthetase